MQDDIKITLYEPWMKPQVAQLFQNEYGIKQSEFEDLMTKLYEHPIQLKKCIQIVALDEQKVVGFQSFFYWPYTFEGKIFNSFQSGNSLTHPDYRGKGIFKKLLNFVFENGNKVDADFFIGFPVQASYGSFVKNKWSNIFDLVWYLKVVNPFGFLFGKSILAKVFSRDFMPNGKASIDTFRLNDEAEFVKWKNELKFDKQNYYYHSFKISDKEEIIFEMKFQVRKKIINEIIIGKVYFKGDSVTKLDIALKDLLKKIGKAKCVTICSICINEQLKNPDYKQVLSTHNFKRLDKKIYFIVKPLVKGDDVLEAQKWDIGRADIDTW